MAHSRYRYQPLIRSAVARALFETIEAFVSPETGRRLNRADRRAWLKSRGGFKRASR